MTTLPHEHPHHVSSHFFMIIISPFCDTLHQLHTFLVSTACPVHPEPSHIFASNCNHIICILLCMISEQNDNRGDNEETAGPPQACIFHLADSAISSPPDRRTLEGGATEHEHLETGGNGGQRGVIGETGRRVRV